MCVIGEGESATLLKGGLVRLLNGDIYHLSDCELKAGGRLVLSLGESQDTPKRKVAKPPRVEGVAMLGDSSEYSFVSPLTLEEVVLISEVQQPPPPPPPPPEIPYSPFSVVGGVLLYVLKKVAGLDRELKAGSCEIRHKEAIVRIAKLEGKVLRKQIVDGAKTAKGLKDKFVPQEDGEVEQENKG